MPKTRKGNGVIKPHERRKKGKNPKVFTRGLAVLLLVSVVIGSGIAAYNMDTLYMTGKTSVTMYIPQKLAGGGKNTLLIHTSDMYGNAQANAGVRIKLETNETTYDLFTGSTDSTGAIQASFDVPKLNEPGTLVITAGSESVAKDVDIDSTIKLLVSTDKPIYQPGQVIHVRTLAFQGLSPLPLERPVTLEIQSPDGDLIFRKDLKSNDFGIASFDYVLSDQLPLGAYKVKASIGEISSLESVLVERYVLPKFEVSLNGVRSWYTLDEDIFGTVSCMYMFGKPVKGSISIDAKTYCGVTWKSVYTDSSMLRDGNYTLHVPPIQYAVGLPVNENNGYLELNVTVADEAGHSESKSYIITLARRPILITAIEDTNIGGLESKYFILTQYPDGSPVAGAQVTIKNYYSYETHTQSLCTDSRGLAVYKFTYNGEYNMNVYAEKNGVNSTESFSESGYRYGIKLFADKESYKVGDVAEFAVKYKGSSMTSWVYYDVVSKGFVVSTGRLQLVDSEGTIKLPITPDMGELTTIRAYKTESNLEVVRDSVLIGVGVTDDMTLSVGARKPAYTPGDGVNIDFSVKDRGEGVSAAIGVSIVDKAVYEMNDRFTGFEAIDFNLENEFTTPSYQINSYIYAQASPYSLPTSSVKKVSKETSVGSLIEIGMETRASADNARNDAVGMYWFVLLSLGLIVFIAGVFLFSKQARKRQRFTRYRKNSSLTPVIAMVFMVVITVVLASVLYTMSIGFGGSGSQTQGRNGFEGPGGDNWGGNARDSDWHGTGIIVPGANGTKGQGTGQISNPSLTEKPTHTRSYFPETWYWNPTLITDENGKASISLTAPDSITTWAVDAFASTKSAKFGSGSTNITVFQDFFVEPDIPVSAVRGDIFPLKVLIYNYDNVSRNVTVSLQKDSWFALVSNASVQIKDVPANSARSVDFVINATEVGVQQVSIAASSGTLKDAVIRDIRIVPDGKGVETTRNGELADNQTAASEIDMSGFRVPNSENAFIKLQAGMEAVTLDGAESYIQFVNGCGEQSMSTLSIDILAYATVEKMNGTDEQMFKYEQIVTQGIQHELMYLMDGKNGIGRGIVWFPEDQDVHPWLTSWGLITFKDAQNAGLAIDEKVIADMQKWLVSQQKKDGSFVFPDWGIYETNNPILKTKTVASTAYIARALLYSGYGPDSDAVKKAMDYIENNIRDQWKDPYTLALSLIALEDGKGESGLRNDIAAQLVSLAKEENGTACWDSPINLISDGDSGYRWMGASSRTIETTGYAIMALYKHGGSYDLVNKGVKYLLSHRNGYGGFFATQDTIVAFQALSQVGNVKCDHVVVTVYADGVEIAQVQFTKGNSDLTYIVDLRGHLNASNKTEIVLKSEGSGRIIYQIFSEEYIPWARSGVDKPKELELDISYDVTNITVNDTIKAHVKLKYTGGMEIVKMLLLDLRAPVGFSFISGEWDSLLSSGKISMYEIKDRQLIVYLDSVHKGVTYEFNYSLKANMPIRGTIQGASVWDMYNPNLRAEAAPVDVVAG